MKSMIHDVNSLIKRVQVVRSKHGDTQQAAVEDNSFEGRQRRIYELLKAVKKTMEEIDDNPPNIELIKLKQRARKMLSSMRELLDRMRKDFNKLNQQLTKKGGRSFWKGNKQIDRRQLDEQKAEIMRLEDQYSQSTASFQSKTSGKDGVGGAGTDCKFYIAV